jgi:biopolymer transport protein ExbD
VEFHRRRKIDAGIDMTPMIDTLLQLFLVFLLTATFAASAIPLNLPKASADQQAPSEAVIVSLDASNQVFINDEPVVQGELRGRLLTSLQKGKERKVILRGDRTLPYEKVLEALVVIQQARVPQVHLAFEEVRRGP